MHVFHRLSVPILLILSIILAACVPSPSESTQATALQGGGSRILPGGYHPSTSPVSGSSWSSLIEAGMDPHTFEPTPRDIITISESQLLIVNGAGLESWLETMLDQESIAIPVIEASSGLTPRLPSSAERVDEANRSRISGSILLNVLPMSEHPRWADRDGPCWAR